MEESIETGKETQMTYAGPYNDICAGRRIICRPVFTFKGCGFCVRKAGGEGLSGNNHP